MIKILIINKKKKIYNFNSYKPNKKKIKKLKLKKMFKPDPADAEQFNQISIENDY